MPTKEVSVFFRSFTSFRMTKYEEVRQLNLLAPLLLRGAINFVNSLGWGSAPTTSEMDGVRLQWDE
jgi:hypothetical protein